MSIAPDYQYFGFNGSGRLTAIAGRMKQKLQWMPPVAQGARVLDVGCDFGFWTFWAREQGAASALGIDRGRVVRNSGFVNLADRNNEAARLEGVADVCRFEGYEIGKQWPDLGQFDHIFCLSVYHHLFQAAGSHEAVWYWLSQRCADGATLIWEGPLELDDPVAREHIDQSLHAIYDYGHITRAAVQFFDSDRFTPAIHEPTRWAGTMHPKPKRALMNIAKKVDGAGGATKAFEYADGRRGKEIAHALGIDPFPGSLNLELDAPFDWDRGYFTADIHDVIDRSKGFDSPWGLKKCRFYPAKFDGEECFAMRFELDNYRQNFVEVVSDVKLRPVTRDKAMLMRVV